MTTVKKTLIQLRLEDDEVALIDEQVNRADRKAWEPRMTRTMFIRKAIHNELARSEDNSRKEAA